jgi:hypothetical protein
MGEEGGTYTIVSEICGKTNTMIGDGLASTPKRLPVR